MIKLFRREATSIPHPEMLPLTEEECQPPTFNRDPMLSRHDYSQKEINRAIRQEKLTGDMKEYCHNNGISWQVNNERS